MGLRSPAASALRWATGVILEPPSQSWPQGAQPGPPPSAASRLPHFHKALLFTLKSETNGRASDRHLAAEGPNLSLSESWLQEDLRRTGETSAPSGPTLLAYQFPLQWKYVV